MVTKHHKTTWLKSGHGRAKTDAHYWSNGHHRKSKVNKNPINTKTEKKLKQKVRVGKKNIKTTERINKSLINMTTLEEASFDTKVIEEVFI